MQTTTGNISSGGLRLFYRTWRPDQTPRGVVAIVPGFNSHSGYYAWVAERLVAQGLAVYAIDLRGRGKSEGERFYVQKFEDYVRRRSRARDVRENKRARFPDLPPRTQRRGRRVVPLRASSTNRSWRASSARASRSRSQRRTSRSRSSRDSPTSRRTRTSCTSRTKTSRAIRRSSRR